jgi:hypothetical protein
MTRTLQMKNICCLLFVRDSLKRVRFRPLRKSGFQAIQRLGKQFASINRSGALVCFAAGGTRFAQLVRAFLHVKLQQVGGVLIALKSINFDMAVSFIM